MSRNINAFSALEVEPEVDDYSGEVEEVQVDALVVLKIVKHAKENYPSPVTGALLGMEEDGVLQVTQSYQYLAKARRGHEDEESHTDLDENYQMEMMKCLRQVNSDANTVGWYHSAPFAHFIQHSWVAIQADFQASIPQSIVLEYDPMASQTGNLALRAFCLTPAFFKLFKGKPKSSLNSAAVSASSLLEEGLLKEMPVIIRNYHLVSAFMYAHNLSEHTVLAPMPGASREQYMGKHATSLLETLDDFGQEQARYAGWNRVFQREKSRMESLVNRKRHENPQEAEALQRQLTAKLPNEPSKLDSILLAHQVAQHCYQMDQFLAPSVLGVEVARTAVAESSNPAQK